MKQLHLLCAMSAAALFTVIGCGQKGSGPDYQSAKTGSAEYKEEGRSIYASKTEAKTEAKVDRTDKPEFNTESYDHISENEFESAAAAPLSTFSIDVDTAAYANLRRFLNQRRLPPAGAIRIEELVNYFNYDYPQPTEDQPFSVSVDVAECPWAPGHQLARIGLKGREIAAEQRPATNLVFLLDVSGSMSSQNKLPLVRSAMKLLVERLDENDRVSIVVYAGRSGLVLPPTSGDQNAVIMSALDRLNAGGSTNGGEGIRLAYKVAEEQFIQGGANRVILCTDGDFNVGITNRSDLIDQIQSAAKGGVFLSVLGFGMGNLKDSTMEQLADKGNGNYGYVDSIAEARKLLVEDMTGTLVTIAKDVKIQVDFNPAQVSAYRLIGYENRMLKAEDFKDDTKDAGEIGAGHTVTALYELQPVGSDGENVKRPVDPTKYQEKPELTEAAGKDELFTVRLRYKQPDGDVSQELRVPAKAGATQFDNAPSDMRFASSVALFGMILRDSKFCGEATLKDVAEMASEARGEDGRGYRKEFLELVKVADDLK